MWENWWEENILNEKSYRRRLKLQTKTTEKDHKNRIYNFKLTFGMDLHCGFLAFFNVFLEYNLFAVNAFLKRTWSFARSLLTALFHINFGHPCFRRPSYVSILWSFSELYHLPFVIDVFLVDGFLHGGLYQTIFGFPQTIARVRY